MRLDQLGRGEEGVVKKVYAQTPLKERLLSFGFTKGARVKVVEHTLARNTFDILINGVNVALRQEEAHQIEVEPVGKGE
jgi:Fe2+ transport system protein FeoA